MLSPVNTHSNMPGFDLLVVGDGAIGMSVAIEFARRHPDARVAIIAPNGRANAASTAAGLMINAFAELEIGQLDDPRGRARFDLVRTAVQCWPDWLAELGRVADIAPPLIRPGTIILGGGRADAVEDRTMAIIKQALVAFKEPHQELNPRDVPGYHPAPSHQVGNAIFLPREGGIPALEVISLLDRAANAMSIHRINSHATGLGRTDHGCSVRMTDGRQVHGHRVVVAAGVQSTPLLDTLPELQGRCPRMLHGVGRAYRIHHAGQRTRPQTVLRSPNRASGGGFHIVPFNEHTAYVGASNHTTDHPGVSHPDDVFPLHEVANHLNIDLRNARIEPLIGYRPIPGDGCPLFGRTAVPSVTVATGTRRDGFTAAPVIARLLVDSMCGKTDLLPDVFRPDRGDLPTIASTA